MATLINCTYTADSLGLGDDLINIPFVSNMYTTYACTPFKWEYAANLVCVIVWLVGFRWLYDGYMRVRKPGFVLSDQLTTRDNPALAIDFAAFLFSMCLITRGSLTDLQPGIDTPMYFATFFIYQIVGCVILLISRVLNDKLMLRKVDNVKAMIDERSVAVACVQAGTMVATAMIFSAASGGEEQSFGEGFVLTLIYFAIGQVLLIAYGNIIDIVTALPLITEIDKQLVVRSGTADAEQVAAEMKATSLFTEAASGNAAAGVAAGFDLVHAGVLITAPIYVGYGIVPWLIFVVASLAIVSPIVTIYLDQIIMRGVAYQVNILRHKNWGAAILQGALKLLYSLVLVAGYSENCDPSTLYSGCVQKSSENLLARLGEVSIPNVFTWQVLTNLVLMLVLMLCAKFFYFMRFACKDGVSKAFENAKLISLDATLADPSNNAVAISLAAFAVAQGLCVVGVVRCPDANAGMHALGVVGWTALGSVLLMLAFTINDVVLLMKVRNTEALARNNIAVATFEGGSFIACGLILRGTLTGGSDYTLAEGMLLTVIYWLLSQVRSRADLPTVVPPPDRVSLTVTPPSLTVIYWLLSQLLLLAFAYVYRLVTSFDDWKELSEGNASAGLSGGATLIALAIIMAHPIPMCACTAHPPLLLSRQGTASSLPSIHPSCDSPPSANCQLPTTACARRSPSTLRACARAAAAASGLRYVSIIVFLPIALVGAIALILVRVIVDKFVLPGASLDAEIVTDKNWGAAIIEGGVAIGVALVTNMYVPPPGPPYPLPGFWDVCS